MGISRRPAKYRSQKKGRASAAGGKKRDQQSGFILTIVDGNNKGKEHLFHTEASVGRIEDNDILIVEPGISRYHMRVHHDHGVYLLEDLQSANGTRLNGEKIEHPEVLRDGDYITIAQTTLQFSCLDAIRGEITADTQLDDKDKRKIDATEESAYGRRPFFRRPLGRLLTLIVVGGAAAGVYFKYFHHRATTALSNRSDEPLTYSDDPEFFDSVFGYGAYDKTHPDQVAVNFEYLGGRVTLQYGAWAVDKVGEVVILLNGEKVGEVPLTMRNWTYGLKLVLPKTKLRRGKTNQVIFDNLRNPPQRDEWELCYLRIIQEAIPPPDPKEANYHFDLAKKAWEDREVEPRNMSEALVGFKKTRDYLEGLEDRPELYQEALDFIDRVDKALTVKFEEGKFTYRRVYKVEGDAAKARRILIRTMRYFKRGDFRHQALKRDLDALAAVK